MAIRIQPLEIEVPKDNPFQNDLLDRRDAADVLTRIIGNIEGSCVLAIDAEWGAGKTTFLNMWAQYLQNQGFPVAKFNAWETDYVDSPLIPLTTELVQALDIDESESVLEATKEIIARTAPSFLRLVPFAGNAMEGIATGMIDYLREEKLSDYQQLKEKVRDFRSTLSEIAKNLSERNKSHPLVVIIDELDRCRPSYAVELLETAKHWFMVDNIVFVLAVNRSELAHSVRVLYGERFDADNYLRRFFDLDFRLPTPERATFVTTLFSATQIDQYFSVDRSHPGTRDTETADLLLRAFLSLPDFGLRTVMQATHRLGLMFSLLGERAQALAMSVVVMLILRTIDSAFYFRFINGGISDQNAINILFGPAGMNALKGSNLGVMAEATIIVGSQSDEAYDQPFEQIASPLLEGYRNNPNDERAGLVISAARSIWQSNIVFRDFRRAVQRLELMSPDLIES